MRPVLIITNCEDKRLCISGDHIDFGLNTKRDLNLTPEQQQKGEGSLVLVQLAHLKSYEHMGIGVARSAYLLSSKQQRRALKYNDL